MKECNFPLTVSFPFPSLLWEILRNPDHQWKTIWSKVKIKIYFVREREWFIYHYLFHYILSMKPFSVNSFEIIHRSCGRDRGYLPLVLEALCAIFVKLSINVENAKIVDLIWFSSLELFEMKSSIAAWEPWNSEVIQRVFLKYHISAVTIPCNPPG